MSNLQTVLIENAKNNASEGYVEGFHGNSYISLGLLYAVSAIFNWLAPTIMIILGLKYTMFIGALCYAAYIATFFYLNDYLLYSGSAVIGFGAALIWTAQVSK